MRKLFSFAAAAALALSAQPAVAQPLAIVGATVVDVGHFGRSHHDIPDAVVLVDQGIIRAVRERRHVPIPVDAKIVNAAGEYLIPGLVDGFGSARSAGFAHAYLYEGVTTVFVLMGPEGEDGEQRVVHDAREPDIRIGVSIGGYSLAGAMPKVHPWTTHRLQDRKLTAGELIAAVDDAAERGAHGILIGLDAWPDQMRTIASEAKKRGLFTMAEPAFATYPQAVGAGVDVLLRNDRYDTAIARPEHWPAYADDPEGRGGAPAFHDVCSTDGGSPRVAAFARLLARSHTALMPVLDMEATADDLRIPNPWSEPAAAFVTAQDLDTPVDPKTGVHPYLAAHPERVAELQNCAYHREGVDAALHHDGVHYVVGTTAPSFGIMPGSGVHQEMALMQRLGFTPREALAAATGNIARVFGWHDVGLIAPGRRADFVLLSKDPREDVANADAIRDVVLKGRFVDRQSLLPKS